MALLKFVHNHNDLSNDRGFQFEFCCDHCGNGYQSSFETSKSGVAADVLNVAGGLFGGILGTASHVGDKVHSAAWKNAHDQAFARAIAEVKDSFQQCSRCGAWVCNEVCWNEERNLCVSCAPKMAGEIAAAQTEVTVQQVRQKLQERDMTGDLDLTLKVKATCPSCGADTKGAKFCPECGTPLTQKRICPRCGTDAESAKFCPECGQKMG